MYNLLDYTDLNKIYYLYLKYFFSFLKFNKTQANKTTSIPLPDKLRRYVNMLLGQGYRAPTGAVTDEKTFSTATSSTTNITSSHPGLNPVSTARNQRLTA